MIIGDKIDINISNSNIKYYKEIGYICNSGSKLTINIKDLPNGSHVKISCKCDICGSIKTLNYRKYIKNINNGNYYSCSRKCSEGKIKSTSYDRYDTEWASQCSDFRESVVQTCIYKYGVINVSQLDWVKELKRDICMKKNGVTHHLKLQKFRNKQMKTCNLLYGFDYPLQNSEIYSKSLYNSFKVHNYKNTNITYQASYEKDFLDNFNDVFDIMNAPPIKYILNDKTHIYYPDFYLPQFNLIIEIKSSWTYNKDLEKNEIKKIYTIKDNYNFLFIIDKKYDKFTKIIYQLPVV